LIPNTPVQVSPSFSSIRAESPIQLALHPVYEGLEVFLDNFFGETFQYDLPRRLITSCATCAGN
jgi:hypothetical protein